MALLKIIHYPNPNLKIKSQPITVFDDKLQTLIDDMYETMYHNHGAGLAAPQVDIHLRLAVIDVQGGGKQKICIINPEIVSKEGDQIDQHGCLSVPRVPGDQLKRAAKLRLKALDRHGQPFELDADGILAICIQHEIDHLDGKLYIDHLSPLKRERLFKRAEKYNKRYTSE